MCYTTEVHAKRFPFSPLSVGYRGFSITIAKIPGCPDNKKQNARARARCQAGEGRQRRLLEEFYVICGSSGVTVTSNHGTITHHDPPASPTSNAPATWHDAPKTISLSSTEVTIQWLDFPRTMHSALRGLEERARIVPKLGSVIVRPSTRKDPRGECPSMDPESSGHYVESVARRGRYRSSGTS